MTLSLMTYKLFRVVYKKHGVASYPFVKVFSYFLPLMIYHSSLVSCMHVIIETSKHYSNNHSSL